MTWKTLVGQIAIRPRKRVIASALVYGLSLAVRFTSATGEEVEISPQSLQMTNPAMSIMTNDGAQFPYAGWGGSNGTEPVFFRRRWPPRASSMPSCHSP
jgi:hypothetical protein